MEPETPQRVSRYRTDAPDSLVTFDLKGANVKMYILSEERLEILSSGYNSVHLAFCTMMLGIFVALAITLSTVDLSNAPHKNAAYWLGFWASLSFSVYFGIMACVGIVRTRRQITAIKRETLLEAKTASRGLV